MNKTKKMLVTLGLFLLITLIGSGIYVNQMLDKLAVDINDYTHSQEVKIEDTKDNTIIESSSNASSKDHQLDYINEPSSESTEDTQIEDTNGGTYNDRIISEVAKNLNQPIKKDDILKAGAIIMKKLSPSEIVYLLNFSEGDYTKEELLTAREILLNKLSLEDIQILQSIARSYGKSLRILDADIEI